jgi:succinate-semialdehyde dehydrogenase/glutarate-semialdehyde dehydrogenase
MEATGHASENLAYVESRNPATGEVIARLEATQPGDLPSILSRARAAQAHWEAQPVSARCARVRRLREVLYERRDELAASVTAETGKPQVEALFGDVLIALDGVEYYGRHAAGFLRDQRVPHHNIAVKAKSGKLRYEPYGIVGIIAPWNYPLAIPLGQIVPALLAGNAVILKCSELTPRCGELIAECFAQAAFPGDLFQVLQGGGPVGAALVEARPDKIVFTGSVATGRRVAEACGRLLIPCVLELGGKDAMIVLADADLEAASSAAVWGSFTNCGQACLSVERIYAERDIAQRFTELCVAKTRELKLGLGTDPENELGPMIDGQSADRIEEQIGEAVAHGAQVLCGGRRRPDLGPAYFEPTVITIMDAANVGAANIDAALHHTLKLLQQETFGPVLTIVVVENAERAVTLANDSAFGLSASVWTHDASRAQLMAAQIRAGAVMINDVGSYFGIAEAPHGGRGLSGWGRTHARIGLMEMVQVKYVDVDRVPGWHKAWWFGYDSDLRESAERFIDFLYAPMWLDRWRGAAAALRHLFHARVARGRVVRARDGG